MTAARGAAAPPAFARALAAQQAGRTSEAIAAYRAMVRTRPGFAPAHFNLGLLLFAQGEFAEAAASFEGAARLRPTAADAWLNLGAALEKLGQPDRATAAYDRAIACAPEDARGHFNRGNALLAAGRVDLAATAYRSAIEVEPGHVEAQWNLAVALLAAGELAEGWRQYEYRWPRQGLDPASRFPFPLWTGEPLAGRRILVWREQGLGDEILFAGCLRELVAAGAEVTFAATDRLVSLFARALPGVRVVADGQWGETGFDVHIPVGSLPRYLRSTRTAFPMEARLLTPDSALATRWATRLDQLPPGLRVGICWRSGLTTHERAQQYTELGAWAPLFAVSGVQWINLQYDRCEEEIVLEERRHRIKIHRWKRENLKDDLESVVGLLWNLDLVITAPTAVASLAGAVGVRTWQLDSGVGWTWHGEDRSPWFPSIARVRRPHGADGWTRTFLALAEDLSALAGVECPVG